MIFTKSETAWGLLLAALFVVGCLGCGGGGSGSITQPPPAIQVSVSTTTATVQPQASAKFSATVLEDSSSEGVTWSMTCNGSNCGTVSPTATASGTTTTYTAPGPPVATLMVKLTATSVADKTKSASVAITVPVPISVSVSPQSAQVMSGGTQQVVATVSNDASHGGVDWSVLAAYESCEVFRGCTGVFYRTCGSACGIISSPATASGTPVTYTAPAHFTPPRAVCFFPFSCPFIGVFVRATSVANSGASAQSGLTILPISVSLAPASASVEVTKTQQFTANVTDDGANKGVSWTLTQNGAACSPACGSLSSTSTASGTALTYTAPANVPPLAVLTIAATSVEDGTAFVTATITNTNASGAACGAGSGSESMLKGHYAFLVQGFFEGSGPDAFIGLGGIQGVVAIAGSFTADGTGKITGGEEDMNTPSTEQTNIAIDTTQSFYSVAADGRGCVALAVSGGSTTYFRFALGALSSGVAHAGHVIEFDDTTGTGMRAAGKIRLQDATSFTASHLTGNYVIGMVGADAGNGRLAVGGTFALDGNSAISSETFDVDDAGTISSNLSATPGGSFTCCSANGRGTLTLQINPNLAFTPNLAFYMISASDLFLVNSAVPPGFPGDNSQYGGEAVGVASGTTFSQASLNSSSVLREVAQSANGPVVNVASASANGSGSITFSDHINNAGAFSASSTTLSYVVDSSGRVTTSGGSSPPVLYLYGANEGFLVGTDADATFGILEPQAAGPFSDTSFSGTYTFGTEDPLTGTVTTESGVVTANGSGNASGTKDQSSPTGLTQNQGLNSSYSFAANGIGNVGTGTTAILISDHKMVFISNTSMNPTITVVEK